MSWWTWVLLWLVLLAGALALLCLLAWRVVTAGFRLTEALGLAADRLASESEPRSTDDVAAPKPSDGVPARNDLPAFARGSAAVFAGGRRLGFDATNDGESPHA